MYKWLGPLSVHDQQSPQTCKGTATLRLCLDGKHGHGLRPGDLWDVRVLENLLRQHALHQGVYKLHLLWIHDGLLEHRHGSDGPPPRHLPAALLGPADEPQIVRQGLAPDDGLVVDLLPVSDDVTQLVRQTGSLECNLNVSLSAHLLYPHPHAIVGTLVGVERDGALLVELHVAGADRRRHALADLLWQVTRRRDEVPRSLPLCCEDLRVQVDLHLLELQLVLKHRD
mmetsp:Transcript_74593/g.230551  ORF Transcript_74593/g.230551 Transcript_74593/m.230551 type:complete len:227 (-) Transcript_74593:715-1395(-)